MAGFHHYLFSGLFSLCQLLHHPVHLVIIVGILLIQKRIEVENIAVSIEEMQVSSCSQLISGIILELETQ